MKEIFTAGTPLSALFFMDYHRELAAMITSWRPYLVNDDPTVEALELSYFNFDKQRIRSKDVYADLLVLVHKNALKTPMALLAYYLSTHSNLSASYTSLYQQLRCLHAQTK